MTRKICFITPHVYPNYRGGAEIQVSHLGTEFLNRGWAVTHIAESNTQPKVDVDPRLKLIFLPKANRHRKFLNHLKLSKILMTESPDVIYVRPVLQYLYSISIISKSIGAQVVWGCSSDSKLDPSYFLKRFNPFGVANYFMFKSALKRITHRVVQTSYQQQTLLSNYGVESTIIPNSHPLPTQEYMATRPQRVLWIGRTAEIKNPIGFLELAKMFEGSAVEFRMIISDIGSKLHQETIDMAAKIKRVTIASDLSNPEVHEEISRSALLVNTSHSEGFSNTFIEAWMRGTPVLALNADPEKLLSTKVGGRLCENLELMKFEIEELLNDFEKWNICSESCRMYSLNELSITNGVNRLEELIENGAKSIGEPSDETRSNSTS